MPSTFRFACPALLLLLAACSEGAPPSPLAAPLVRQADAATVTSGTGVYVFQADVPFHECVGEVVRADVRAEYTYRLVRTPKGDALYVERWTPQSTTGTLTGLTSGHVWVRTRTVSPFISHTVGGGVTHYTFRGTFVSETGPTLEVREMFHVSADATGTVRVERVQMKCWEA